MKLLTALLLVFLVGCGTSVPPPTATTAALPPKGKDNFVQFDAATVTESGIQLGKVTSRPQAAAIQANGHLVVNEDATWLVGALTSGKMMQVLAKTGDLVKTGDVLAWMHSDDVHNTRAVYRQNLDELQRRKVLSEHARRVRDRTQRLFDLKAASREQLEAAETELRNTEHAVATAEIEIAKEKTHLTEFLEVPVESATQALIPIRAPATGTVTDRMATLGTVVTAGNHVFTLSNLSTLWMLAAVNEADLAGVRVGQPVTVTVKSYPGETFAARVIKLGEKLDATTRTLQVRVAVPNPGGRLKPEMFASAEIAAAVSREVPVVPERAVQELAGAKVVFVETRAGHYEPRKVTVGATAGGYHEIVSGVAVGEAIVTHGAFLLKSEILRDPTE
jgi:cobalt-zinc-cadmium efflux system membrane fusion protein